MAITLDHVKTKTASSFTRGSYNRLKGREKVAVYIKPTPIKAGSALSLGAYKYKVEHDSFLVYIDLLHDNQCIHPVVYELHNAIDGTVKTIEDESSSIDNAFLDSFESFILPRKEGKSINDWDEIGQTA